MNPQYVDDSGSDTSPEVPVSDSRLDISGVRSQNRIIDDDIDSLIRETVDPMTDYPWKQEGIQNRDIG